MHTRLAINETETLLHIATRVVESFIADAERDDKKRTTYTDESMRSEDNICLGFCARVIKLCRDLLISFRSFFPSQGDKFLTRPPNICVMFPFV